MSPKTEDLGFNIKLGRNLGCYQQENNIFPVICFKYQKIKIATLKNYPPYCIWWEDKIPLSKELKKEILGKWEKKKNQLIRYQNNICTKCNKILKIPILHHKKTEGLLEILENQFKEIDNNVSQGKITVMVAYNKRMRKIESYCKYYCSLKDVEVICNNCHYNLHRNKQN